MQPNYALFIIKNRCVVNPGAFLVTNKRLYSRVCPSVGRSVRRSVRPSVRRSVRRSIRPSVGPSVRGPSCVFLNAEFKPKSNLTSINAPAQRSRLYVSCIRTCFIACTRLYDLFRLSVCTAVCLSIICHSVHTIDD